SSDLVDATEFSAFALATVVSLENPNLEVLQLSGSESLESLAFYQFWQAAEVGQSVLRWKKC
ncbi:MAG: beta-ketoacyl synthase, partial [Acinetobacter sp.]|nr:beta-ketoacyl synthase [Acinetobacter sp.]